jgi:hypothetical protein
VARLSLVVAFVAVCASIGSFVAILESSSSGWGVYALNRVSDVLVLLSIALALAVVRRATQGAWQAQIAAAAVALAFVIVALVKLYTARGTTFPNNFGQASNWAAEAAVVSLGALSFGLIGLRATTRAARICFIAAVCAAVGCVAYGISLKLSGNAFVWYSVAATPATLAGSAAARMLRY